MEYNNIIYDFDGTLVDTATLILATMRRTISTLHLPEKSEDECRSMIGYRLEEIPFDTVARDTGAVRTICQRLSRYFQFHQREL